MPARLAMALGLSRSSRVSLPSPCTLALKNGSTCTMTCMVREAPSMEKSIKSFDSNAA
ncbi:hypothetical protein ACE1OG_07230 [Aeromonas hydrophila]|uniref:hypothetical protein n=1 Tax=Aeromonas hydrophila TaxID=644 RepID=UPI0022AE6CAF|nr:hypothetical protein [Aeromonas hydrophila]MCZ4331650.1 hypothetical protein [Aeromonas hydrophila]